MLKPAANHLQLSSGQHHPVSWLLAPPSPETNCYVDGYRYHYELNQMCRCNHFSASHGKPLLAATLRPVSVSRFSRCSSARISEACW
jgi:hypothetical protein